VNVETELVHEIKSRGSAVFETLLARGGNVVLEMTERAAIKDFDLFREGIAMLQGLGFKIAIDDAGSGYASLQAIAELRPNYLKISNYLVTSAKDPIKRDVEMLVRLGMRTTPRRWPRHRDRARPKRSSVWASRTRATCSADPSLPTFGLTRAGQAASATPGG
jgi:hypothetical protein